MALKGVRLTEEHKRKIGLANSISLLGKKQSPERVEKRRLKLIGKKRTLETLIRMSLSQKGKPKWTEEQKREISERQKGRKISEKTKQKMRESAKKGSGSLRWKGDDVGYSGLHAWVYKTLGKPTKCEICGKDNLNERKIHWANKSKKYKRDIHDWIRLCVSCHYKYDKICEKRHRNIKGMFI